MATQTDYQYTYGDSVDGFLHSFIAEGAISAGQVLELGTAGRQVKKHTTTTTTITIRITMDDASDGDPVVVLCPCPIKKVISDSNGITRGEMVYASGTTAGSCQSRAYADGTTLYGAIGIALETGDAAGEKVPVLCGWLGVVAAT